MKTVVECIGGKYYWRVVAKDGRTVAQQHDQGYGTYAMAHTAGSTRLRNILRVKESLERS